MSSTDQIVEATIHSLSDALSSGKLTSVDLVAKFLLRIATYDCRNTTLNAVPLINENVFQEAAAADDRRVTGRAAGDLDGIPFTVKDSYKVKGMTVASGSEAFQNLLSNQDAFTVEALKGAGAVLLGKTNMCPMAYGGMLRGVYGRAESPYNLDYLPAAFGSGSSNGSGVSVAASFAAFGMGEETVSSGRSPASNNGLVAYTPSRGLISIRGNWPLYPTCDVVVPHTRTVDDLLALLDVITKPDPTTAGDFWRDQPFIPIPTQWTNPPKSFATIKDGSFLKGKRIAVPRMYVEAVEDGPHVSAATTSLWKQAQTDLEGAGATIHIVDEFPTIQVYDNPPPPDPSQDSRPLRLPGPDWNLVERGILIALPWEDFLQANQDPHFPSLTQVDPAKIFPQNPPDNVQVKYTEPTNKVLWNQLADYITSQPPSTRPGKSPIYDVPELETALHALENMRTTFFESWLSQNHYDLVAFPAAGDVASALADIDDSAARHAWTRGVKYSHGDRCFRHLGIPSVTVPMGLLDASNMPMGVTFMGPAYQDVEIMKAAWAYEQKSKRRVAPPLTPALPTDYLTTSSPKSSGFKPRPDLTVTTCSAEINNETTLISITGSVAPATTDDDSHPILSIFIDGHPVPASSIQRSQSTFRVTNFNTPSPPVQDARNQVVGKVARDSTMVMILARDGEDGLPAGWVRLIHRDDQQRK